jgi:hypothetical protein
MGLSPQEFISKGENQKNTVQYPNNSVKPEHPSRENLQ